VAKETGTAPGWRIVWGIVGAGLTATVLSVSGLGLSMPVLVGASVGGGVAVALGGPMLLDLLSLV
jgi:hypothetical protein